jgi:hypothetical protein
MHVIKGTFLILTGLFFVGLGVFLTASWIAFCFGTVVIGILMLLFAPLILLFPYMVISNPGWNLVDRGILVSKRIVI